MIRLLRGAVKLLIHHWCGHPIVVFVRTPVTGDTITIGSMVAEFKEAPGKKMTQREICAVRHGNVA
jgi:hypothetical protein